MANPEADRKAFEILVRQNHRRLLAYALALVEQTDVAEDLVQSAFVTAYENLAKFDTTRDFGPWIRGILRMKYLEWARGQRDRALDEPLLDALEEQQAEWDRAAQEGRGDVLEALQHCLRRLPDFMQDVVRSYYMEHRTGEDIAAGLGATAAAVRKWLQRARESLALCIRKTLGVPNA
jgi:RNA polymerase sigma-70 factor (ECF subfamily)